MKAIWLKFGDTRINLAQIGFIRRDGAVLRFFNVDGAEFCARQFESESRAKRVLDELFKADEIQLLRSYYEGSEPDSTSD